MGPRLRAAEELRGIALGLLSLAENPLAGAAANELIEAASRLLVAARRIEDEGHPDHVAR